MNSKIASKHRTRRTTMVPVTTMEEVPVLSEEERAELLRSLKQSEERIARGEAVEYDPAAFKNRLIGIYRSRKRR
jgi:hypothetical protein